MRTRKLKTILSCLLSLCVLGTGVLSGCGQSDVRSDEVAPNYEEYDSGVADFNEETALGELVTISGWLNPDCVKNLMAYLAKQFPDCKFNYRYISKGSYEYLMDSQLSSKTASDIVMLSPTMAKKHAKNRYIEDITNLCDDFDETGRTTFMYGNRIYAVPCTSDYLCVFYNKDLLKKTGRRIPVSFDEFLDLCDYVQENMGIKPMSAGFKDSEMVANSAMAMLGSSFFATEEGKNFGNRVAYGRARFKDDIRPYMGRWQDLLNHKVYTREMCIMDDTAAISEFAAGDSLMYQGVLYDYNRIKEANPDIRMGTMALSTELQGKTILIGGCNNGFGLNKNAKNKDLAVKVLKAIASEQGQRALWEDRQGSQTYLKDVRFDNPTEFDYIRPLTTTSHVMMPWTEWGAHSSEIYKVLGQELQKVVLGDRSIEIAFQVIDDKVRQILTEN